MAVDVTMTLGPYSFDPVPTYSLTRETITPENKYNSVGFLFTMELEGVLVGDGLVDLLDQQSGLRYAANLDGQLFEVNCGGDTIVKLRPEIKSLTFSPSNNQWVQTMPYTLVLEYQPLDDWADDNRNGDIAKIASYEETWDVEFLNESKRYYQWDLSVIPTGERPQPLGDEYYGDDSNNPFEAQVTHTITCVGKRSWVGTGDNGVVTYAVDNALDFITSVGVGSDLGYDGNAESGEQYGHAIVDWYNLSNKNSQNPDATDPNYGDFRVVDNFRSSNVNEGNGTVTVVESFRILGENTTIDAINGKNSLARNTSEDFSIDVVTPIDQGPVTVNIQGQIQGFEVLDFGTVNGSNDNLTTNVATSGEAILAAESGWAIIKNRVFPRAQYVFRQDNPAPRQLNPVPVNKSVSFSPSQGLINYSYEFNDRPCAFISNAISENITIVDNHPTDVFATLPVLGRSQGPVLQSLSTITEATREITVEAVMPPPSGCSSISELNAYNPSGEVQTFICLFETELTDANNQVFKNADNTSWNPLTGRYSRTVGWTYQDCGTSGSTSLC